MTTEISENTDRNDDIRNDNHPTHIPQDPQIGALARFHHAATDEDTLEWLCIEYHERYVAGEQPNPAAYVLAYPHVTRDLVEFFVYFHCITVDLPDAD
jgi:hypothetical protein